MLRLTHEDKRKGLKAEYFGVRVKQGGLGGSSEKQLLSWEGKWKPDCDWQASEHLVHWAVTGRVEISIPLLRDIKVPSKAFIVEQRPKIAVRVNM